MQEKHNIIAAILNATVFIFLFWSFILTFIIHYVRKKKILLTERKILELQFEQKLLQAEIEMQEHTFKFISQEIHDNVGQILSLTKMNLNILLLETDGSEGLNTIKELVNKTITELHGLTTGYYSDGLLENGLLAGIYYQVAQLQKTEMIKVSCRSDIERIDIDKQKTVFLYRIMQEIFHNVMKHSHADTMNIHIFQQLDKVHICVSDNGRGFDRNQPDFKPGIGLKSIQQRALMIGVTAQIESETGKGTVVNLIFKQND